MSWWQHISLITIQSIHAPHHLLYMFHRVLPRKKKKHTTPWRHDVLTNPRPKNNKMSSLFSSFYKADGALLGFKNGHCSKLIAPQAKQPRSFSNWGRASSTMAYQLSWRRNDDLIKPYDGVCGFCGKRRLQQIEAYYEFLSILSFYSVLGENQRLSYSMLTNGVFTHPIRS